MRVLGISCWYHDAAACLLEDGRIVAAAQEERFTRNKHDAAFPSQAVRYCLAEAGSPGRLDAVAFYDKPILKFHRLLETWLAVAPRGLRQFLQGAPVWLREKLWIELRIQEALEACGVEPPDRIHFPEHHFSHAASAFYPSPFDEAAVLTLDGVGEWATATIGDGSGARLDLLRQLDFPHSLGLLYSAFTYYCGFRVNSGEYKLMGLAPYGEPTYRDLILERLLDLKEDGSFRLDQRYFSYTHGLTMTSEEFHELFGGPPRRPESPLTRREMDLARSVQAVTEEIVLRAARHARDLTGREHLCMAGGVALNCVANGILLREGIFRDLWIQPAAGDAGGAVGAAYAIWHDVYEGGRSPGDGRDRMQGALLGPAFSADQIREFLETRGYPYEETRNDDDWADRVAHHIEDQRVVGLFQGRMEFGPRALGSRSILGDPRSPKMQSVMNLKIKYRESFRPFAPSCLEEVAEEVFDLDRPSPYMLLVAPVRRERRVETAGDERDLDIVEWVNRPRSDVPAITHVDYSARIQTVSRETHPRYHRLIEAFRRRTGCGLVINTSFNVRGEPIVCTPEDAYRCFMRTEMDVLSLGPFLLEKECQPAWHEEEDWREQVPLD